MHPPLSSLGGGGVKNFGKVFAGWGGGVRNIYFGEGFILLRGVG